jgi:predicted ArsR family transcriptional regulator
VPVPRSEPARRRPPGARRAALLEFLRAQDRPLSVAELAPLVGLHPNTVRAHLDVLVRTGEVSRRSDARNTPGRPRELYEATGVATGDRNYRLLAQVLAGRLAELTDDPAREAVTAGRHWAEKQGDDDATVAVPAAPAAPTAPSEPLVPVLRMLRASGFAPELSPDGSQILLHHCPFLELAVDQPDVVCGAHLGLIQGALEGTGVAATRILPFVQPHVCVTELRPGSASAPGEVWRPAAQ